MTKPECECWACKAKAEGKSDLEVIQAGKDMLKSMIEQMGIAVLGIPGDDGNGPTLCYTVGMTDIGFPEVIVIGLPIPLAQQFINIYHAQLLSGDKKPGELLIEDYFNCPIQVINADEEAGEVFAHKVAEYYEGSGAKPKYVQWVLSDRMGKFEWEKGYDKVNMPSIPLLGPIPAHIKPSVDHTGDIAHFTQAHAGAATLH